MNDLADKDLLKEKMHAADLFCDATGVEFVFDVEDFNFCNSIQSTAHCNCSSSTAGSDQDHLHSLEIDALFGQCLPVSHTIGVVAFQFSGYLTVFVAEVDYGIDSAA